MIEKIEGIVVSELEYGETSKIINVLTKELGIGYKDGNMFGEIQYDEIAYRCHMRKHTPPFGNVCLIGIF